MFHQIKNLPISNMKAYQNIYDKLLIFSYHFPICQSHYLKFTTLFTLFLE